MPHIVSFWRNSEKATFHDVARPHKILNHLDRGYPGTEYLVQKRPMSRDGRHK